MKKITREVTAKIKIIETMTDDDAADIIRFKEEAEKNVSNDLRKLYNANEVNVEIKDTVTEADDCRGAN